MSSLPLAVESSGSAPPSEIASCPHCGSRESKSLLPLHDTIWAKPGEFALAQCTACSLAYLSPRPTREGIGFYYQGLYDEAGLKFEEGLQHGAIAGFLNKYRLKDLLSRRALAAGEQHLDVGCGVGAFLLRVARTTGASATGVDFDAGAVASAKRHAKEAGLPVEVLRGMLGEQPLAPASFATVSMIHFLEHSFDPMGDLTISKKLLAPGGAIVIEVPSFDSLARSVFGKFWLPYLVPQHITLFSKKTLAQTLTDAGFSDVHVRDSFAPFVWTSSFVLFWHATLGGRSRHAKNIAARAFTLLFTLLFFVPIVIFDVLISIVLPWFGKGEHIRATAVVK